MPQELPHQDDTFHPCATDPELFHRNAAKDVAAAKHLCASCSLENMCRNWARTHHEWGTWGGETSAERANAGFTPRGRR